MKSGNAKHDETRHISGFLPARDESFRQKAGGQALTEVAKPIGYHETKCEMREGGESGSVVFMLLLLLLLELNVFPYPSSLCFLHAVEIVMPPGYDLIRLKKNKNKLRVS
jgi:hypothetical protein